MSTKSHTVTIRGKEIQGDKLLKTGIRRFIVTLQVLVHRKPKIEVPLGYERVKSEFSKPRQSADALYRSFIEAQINQHNETEYRMLELGCGDGSKSRVAELEPKKTIKVHYIGVDLSVKDMRFSKNVNAVLLQNDAVSFMNSHKGEKFNLVMSHSLLEHTNDDIELVRKSIEMIREEGVIIHVVPGSAALFAYPLHGIRHYTTNLLKSLIVSEKSKDLLFVCYASGGWLQSISWGLLRGFPSLLKSNLDFSNSKFGKRILRMSISVDNLLPSKAGIFYALVIKSNSKY